MAVKIGVFFLLLNIAQGKKSIYIDWLICLFIYSLIYLPYLYIYLRFYLFII